MKLGQFFVSMFKVGCIGFGGGSTLIPILHKTYVEEQKVINEIEYEEAVVISSITPGALTIKLAGEIGRHVAGWRGMLVGASAMALPGVLLTTIILSLISGIPASFTKLIEIISIGVMAYISCVLTDYIIKTFQDKKSKEVQCVRAGIVILVFVLSSSKILNTLEIFIATFTAIFLIYRFEHKETEIRLKTVEWSTVGKEVAIMLGVVAVVMIPAVFVTKEALVYAGNGALSSLISFGGGDAYLTVAEGLFVNVGLISEEGYYGTIVPLVNLLPGSILCKVLSGIGYWIGYAQTNSVLGGWLIALLGFACSFAASCGIVSVVGSLYRSFGEMPIFKLIKQWIRPVVSGLMLNVILSLFYQSRVTGIAYDMGWVSVWIMLAVYFVNLLMFYMKKMSNVVMVMVSVGLTIGLYSVL